MGEKILRILYRCEKCGFTTISFKETCEVVSKGTGVCGGAMRQISESDTQSQERRGGISPPEFFPKEKG